VKHEKMKEREPNMTSTYLRQKSNSRIW